MLTTSLFMYKRLIILSALLAHGYPLIAKEKGFESTYFSSAAKDAHLPQYLFLDIMVSFSSQHIVSNKGLRISKGEATLLTAKNGGVKYIWSDGSGVISTQSSNSLLVKPQVTTTYRVELVTSAGDTERAEITIEVRADLAAVRSENFFTPNGDGINDVWVIENITEYPNHTLSILDRAGKLVFKVRNYKNDWDGKFNGVALPQGTYYYSIDFDDVKLNLRVKRGFISILR